LTTLSSLKPNDILYTKDGRKSGNLCVIEVIDNYQLPSGIYPLIIAISDYGNIVKFLHSPAELAKQFYTNTGTTDSTHKYHNYKLNYPEYSI
jgi:hypothetical protein